jgi:hypothetical protein
LLFALCKPPALPPLASVGFSLLAGSFYRGFGIEYFK